jgi:hypothetical protein
LGLRGRANVESLNAEATFARSFAFFGHLNSGLAAAKRGLSPRGDNCSAFSAGSATSAFPSGNPQAIGRKIRDRKIGAPESLVAFGAASGG